MTATPRNEPAEARPEGAGLKEHILGNAALYDAVQRLAGIERVRRQLAPVLGGLRPGRLLDVGAGTGAFYGSVLLSRSGQYHLLRGDLAGRASPGHE